MRVRNKGVRKMNNGTRWLVRHRDGWCATKNGKRFRDDAWSVDTKCAHVVTLPSGMKRGIPDCPDCRSVLRITATEVVLSGLPAIDD